jgi:GT2 family glycosyltransferase
VSTPTTVTGPNQRISVVMITRNRREQVLSTLPHLLDLPDRPPVILVDNGSSDGTADAVRQVHPAVTVLGLPDNLGAPARTVGLRAATTPYVAFSDDDSWWTPGSLTRAAEHFDAHPRLGLLGARILVGPQQRVDPICALMADSPLPILPDLPGRSVLGFIACAAAVRRSAYLQVGGFSPVLFFLGEESLLAQDLAAAGWGLAYVDDVVVHHDPRPGPTRAGRARLQVRNRLLASWMRRPGPICLRDTLAALAQARDKDVRAALRDALRGIPAVWAERQLLPPEIESDLRRLERAGSTGAGSGDIAAGAGVSLQGLQLPVAGLELAGNHPALSQDPPHTPQSIGESRHRDAIPGHGPAQVHRATQS